MKGTQPVLQKQAGAENWGRLLFGYFLLATQEKVTSCRAATGEV
jgi:hypothetical protein